MHNSRPERAYPFHTPMMDYKHLDLRRVSKPRLQDIGHSLMVLLFALAVDGEIHYIPDQADDFDDDDPDDDLYI
jgi:hypothetical protein